MSFWQPSFSSLPHIQNDGVQKSETKKNNKKKRKLNHCKDCGKFFKKTMIGGWCCKERLDRSCHKCYMDYLDDLLSLQP